MGVRVGIVGGNGWIGRALARSLVESGLLAPSGLTLSCRSAPPDWLPGAEWTQRQPAPRGCGRRRRAVGAPRGLARVRLAAGGKLVISVMAGVPLAAIAGRTGTGRVVRALPNAAAEVGQSYTPWTAGAGVTDADRQQVRRILEACGTEDEVESEAAIDYLTGLCGTGPAYPALLARTMMEDAIARGIPQEVARRAVVGLLVGTGRIFEKTGEDPGGTVAAFLDYRGVTAAAIEAMLAGGFREAVGAGLAAALEKTGSMTP